MKYASEYFQPKPKIAEMSSLQAYGGQFGYLGNE